MRKGGRRHNPSSNGAFFLPVFFSESSYQPPALFLAIAVIQIYLEDITFFVSHDKVAAVSPCVPLTATARKAAEALLAELSGIQITKKD